MDSKAIMKNFTEQQELMNDKVQSGIEAYRKGYFKINFTDESGEPVRGAKISVKQLSSEFKFGCNLFKLGCFKSDEHNAMYEEKFAKLFNMATLPFYWSGFEPEQGKPRFDKNSPFIDRRIPPEYGLEFCRKHNMEAKGHPLYWQVTMPDWLPDDYEQIKLYWTKRLEEIAARYDGIIRSFDCVNECTTVPLLTTEPHKKDTHYRNFKPLRGVYPEWAFRQTAHFFRKSKLVLNETAGPWSDYRQELSPYYLLADNLIQRGAQVDIIGLQYHNFNTTDNMHTLAEKHYNPMHLYKVMDTYATLGRPLSVSEITVPGYDEELQAQVITNLYSIWFSHPAMESIIYWNLGDNCAITNENRAGWGEDVYQSGFFRNDFTNKPVFDALDELINKKWRTDLELDAAGDNVYFKAFYGDYEVTAVHEGKKVTRKLHLSKNGYDEFYFEF